MARKSLLKRAVSSFTALAIATVAMPVIPAFAEAGTVSYSFDGYDVEYSVKNEWTDGQSIEVKITNTGDEPILNWAFKYDAEGVIDGLWNATVYDTKETSYVIKNVGWNYEIAPDASVSFGYTLSDYSGTNPNNFELCAKRVDKTEGYDVQYNITNEWDTGLQGEIVITNTSEESLEAWELSFDSTFEINNLWNGKVISSEDNHYVVASEMWSNPIDAGESRTIGFIGIKSNESELSVDNYALSVVVIDTNENNGGNDNPEPDPDIDLKTDTDGDGLPDTYESFFGTDPNKIDTDGDGLTDLEEIGLTRTDPLVYNSVNPSLSDELADSDGDGLTNREELIIGTVPTQADTDNDRVNDYDEINVWHTDPLKFDTDEDGVVDGDEIKIGLDPTNPETFGYPDIEFKSTQHISEDSISLSTINNENNDIFTYSVDITSNGYIEPYIKARESVYTNVMKNDFMIGIAPELVYHGMYDIDSVKVSFKISDSFIENNKEADESNIEFLHGINIFRYYESANALLPVATYFDNENNTVYTESDAITTYCLMDMDSWVEMMERYAPKEKITLKKSVRGFNELNTLIGTNNEDDYRMEVSETQEDSFISVAPKFSVMSQSSLIASNEVKSVVETDEKTEDVIDVVFVIQSAGTDRSYFLSEIETIENVSKMLFNYSSRVRISIIDYKLKSSIPSVEWYDSFSDVQYRLSKLRYSYSNENDYCDRGAAFNAINKYANFIKNAGKFVMHFVNGRTTSNTLIDHINLCKENNINVSEFNPYGWYYISSSYGEKVKNTITSTGGLYKTFDYIKPEQLFNHIINNLADPQDDFVGLVPTGWKELVLSAPLEQDSLTDTDDDGKTDWNEVDNKLLSWDSTGKIKPISYEVYCKIVDPFGYSNFIDAYKYNTEHWRNTPIIPLVSDPTKKDSDDDKIPDIDDEEPFTFDILKNYFVVYDREGADLCSQAYWMADYAYQNENVEFILLHKKDKFIDVWNNQIPKYVNSIHLYLHGGGANADITYIAFYGEELYAGYSDFKELEDKYVDTKVYLNSCQGGTIRSGISNAMTLSESIINDSPVEAMQEDSVDYLDYFDFTISSVKKSPFDIPLNITTFAIGVPPITLYCNFRLIPRRHNVFGDGRWVEVTSDNSNGSFVYNEKIVGKDWCL